MSSDNCKPRTTRKPKTYTTKTIDPRSHAFNVGIAKDYDPGIALWLGHVAFWTEKNLANNQNIHDGLAWCYDTLEALCDYFPYYSQRQLETIINNSVNEGLVKRGNYNHTGYDRTVWYALTPKAYFYFQHLLNNKYLERLYFSISQICEMDFTEWGNGFPRIVTPIPDTPSDTDPDKKSGVLNPSQHNVSTFPSKSELHLKRSLESEAAILFFNTKFSGLAVTYEQLFNDCKEHYEAKGLWVTVKKWKAWLERETLDKYSKSATNIPKAPPNETESERRLRQYFTNEIIKENKGDGYISEKLKELPQMREKYSHYAR